MIKASIRKWTLLNSQDSLRQKVITKKYLKIKNIHHQVKYRINLRHLKKTKRKVKSGKNIKKKQLTNK